MLDEAAADGRAGLTPRKDSGPAVPAPVSASPAPAPEVAPLSLLRKAEKVLAAFDGTAPWLSLTEVIRRSGLPRSSAHRILDQLVQLRWLEREGRDYRMGMRILEHGGLAAHHNRLLRAALPKLDALHEATGKLVQLYVLDDIEVVCLERIGSLDAHVVPTRVGARLPAHCTAAGKAVLGFGDPAGVERVVEAGLHPRTHRTVTHPSLFRTELMSVRDRGIAYDLEGTYPGLMCAAVPLRGAGRAIAAVSVSSMGGHRTLERLAPLLQSCARSIWTELYGPGRAARFAPPVEAPPAAVPVPMDTIMDLARPDSWM
ncbi:IclR family transcriptional regulator [Streptomyces sp. NPDC058534]|uniref:IclR family transcriptional regulator n=1 Tax=Streptomyces sp. NPDC058534 TaxID=3346541 RepID=UPI0036571CBE